MGHLQAIGKPPACTRPEWHGDLWETLDACPTRFRYQTGHGFMTRALLAAHLQAAARCHLIQIISALGVLAPQFAMRSLHAM